ncbi:MAG: hypothetical protein ACE15D_15000 [Candidatus Eisenbacteria bacterium]|nr:hypothetical protein [Candidatus Eisenbacteria bacterium]
MPTVSFTEALRREYERLFETCVVRPERAQAIETITSTLQQNRARYEAATARIGVPWFFAGAVHSLEADLDFTKHLHNGDPLDHRTVHVPAGRPLAGNPPFRWEESAADALGMRGVSAQTDWSLAGTLYQLEAYNGWGYRLQHPHVLSPYLWAGCRHYQSGKYVADGTWSDTAVSKQCGAAVLLRRMVERGMIEFADRPAPPADAPPLVVRYSETLPSDPAVVARAEGLQRWLNTIPGIFVKVDGVPGPRTSDAYRKVTGSYLPGDPRG